MEESKIVGSGMMCKCPHHKVVPWVIVLIGVDFLLGAVGVLTWSFVNITWPILLIVAGFTKMGMCKCCGK